MINELQKLLQDCTTDYQVERILLDHFKQYDCKNEYGSLSVNYIKFYKVLKEFTTDVPPLSDGSVRVKFGDFTLEFNVVTGGEKRVRILVHDKEYTNYLQNVDNKNKLNDAITNNMDNVVEFLMTKPEFSGYTKEEILDSFNMRNYPMAAFA